MSTPLNDEKYTIGIDFGTLSARAVVAGVSNGEIIGTSVMDYPHGVMDKALTAGDGRALPHDFALQVPADYIEVMTTVVPEAVREAGIDPATVIGIGIDVTSATVIVTDAEGTPICENPEFVNNPHAYVKLWKHHGAQDQVERIVALAKERNASWLSRYGGTLSSEMLLPKSLETLEKAPEVYAATAEIIDILDWLTWNLTGELTYAAGSSGYKRMYQDGEYVSREFLEALNPEFGGAFEEKMSHAVMPLGARIGGLTEDFAQRLGLSAGIAIAAGNIDAHVHAASVGAVASGQLTGILGTSTCWVLPSTELREVPGVFGIVDGGIVDGCWGYEAGQSAVGDSFAWFVDNCVPADLTAEAASRGISVHALLTEQAAAQEIGAHGLVALDWWNGNRSTLVDAKLSGLMIGQTLATTAADQYRALVESTAFGARMIIENFEEHGVPISEVRVAGGLLKNEFLMQLYADVTRKSFSSATVEQAGAQGSAIFAAVAAGEYDTLVAAAGQMGGFKKDAYVPCEESAAKYDELYAIYKRLYNFFGREDETMHELRRIRDTAAAK